MTEDNPPVTPDYFVAWLAGFLACSNNQALMPSDQVAIKSMLARVKPAQVVPPSRVFPELTPKRPNDAFGGPIGLHPFDPKASYGTIDDIKGA